MDILERLDRIEMGDQVLSDAATEIRRLRALSPPEPTEAETLRRQLQYAADFWRGQLAAEMWHPTREHIEMVISSFDRAALRAMPLQQETREQALSAARAIDTEYLSHVSLYARQSENGINNPHLRWMVEQMADMPENKTQRWLGYIQGVLVAQGRATLADMKDLNRRAMVAEQQTEAKS